MASKHKKNRKDDLEERAENIAQREAERVWDKTGSLDLYQQAFLETYNGVLMELQPLPILDNEEEAA